MGIAAAPSESAAAPAAFDQPLRFAQVSSHGAGPHTATHFIAVRDLAAVRYGSMQPLHQRNFRASAIACDHSPVVPAAGHSMVAIGIAGSGYRRMSKAVVGEVVSSGSCRDDSRTTREAELCNEGSVSGELPNR